MEFIKANFLNTTTQVSLSPNTQTSIIPNLYNRDTAYQFYTDGMKNDATTASITITFDSTTFVSRILLLDHNLKSFTVYYNGATANTFGLSTTGQTTVSSWITNSVTSHYLRTTTAACSSITIDMKATQTPNLEKVLGLLVLSDTIYETTFVPNAKDYKPKYKSKQVVHKMSDGGTRLHQIKNKWEMNIKADFVSQTETDALYSIWSMLTPFNFIPFPTSTGWDGIVFESIWEGDFDFFEYSDNASASGFSGSIKLRETPN